MEASVMMGSSQSQVKIGVGVGKAEVNLRELGFVNFGNDSKMLLSCGNRVCFSSSSSQSRNLRNSSDGVFRFALKAAQSANVVPAEKVASDSASYSDASLRSMNGLRVFVGLPLDGVSECGKVNHEKGVTAGLKALKLMGLHGVELPIWWGQVEKEAMGKYNWSGYIAIAELVQKIGLKLHVSLCFHASQKPNIPLPNWVSRIGEADPNIFFTDRSGHQYKDCLSLAVDDMPIFDGKSPLQVYQDFCESFKSSFAAYMGSTITGVTVGLGPDGELRYPSSHLAEKPNNNPGVGEFQCYDKYMLGHLKQHGEETGNPLWGSSGPHDVPTYDQPPNVNTFFKDEGGSWESTYGNFFLSWYSSQLTAHGQRVLSLASSTFDDNRVTISGKLPLAYSWYKTRSHPAELTAGFHNTATRNGYEAVVEMFAKNSCKIILPGMDLLDEHQPNGSSPQSLLAQIKGTCRNHGVRVSGQNLSISGVSAGFGEIKKNVSEDNGVVDLFTYQRMGAEFFSPTHFPMFTGFIRSLNQLDLDSDDMPQGKAGMESVQASSEAQPTLQAQAV